MSVDYSIIYNLNSFLFPPAQKVSTSKELFDEWDLLLNDVYNHLKNTKSYSDFGRRKLINGDKLFSNHASFDELYNFAKQLNPQKIFLVHMGNKPGIISDYDISKKIAFDKQMKAKPIKCEKNKIYILEDKYIEIRCDL